MIKEKQLNVGKMSILYDANLDSIPLTAWPYLFDVNYIQQYGLTTHIAHGRGETYFYDYESYHFVLKHYWRGGLISKFNKDLYFKTSLQKTRAYKEWSLLVQLNEWQLPVPKPAGVRVLTGGLFYYADMLTHQIKNASPLSDLLVDGKLPSEQWCSIGKVIKQFHDKGVYHDDLNAHNILRSENCFYLIDFDKSDIRKAGEWKSKNLSRLKRSLQKQLGVNNELGKSYGFGDQEWSQLIKGYES